MHFACYLKNGSVMHFGNDCKHIKYIDMVKPTMLEFKNTKDGLILAIIPADTIKYILWERDVND